MKEIKTTMNIRVRAEYEPVKVKVMKVTPQGVLCASGGLQAYNKGITQ